MIDIIRSGYLLAGLSLLAAAIPAALMLKDLRGGKAALSARSAARISIAGALAVLAASALSASGWTGAWGLAWAWKPPAIQRESVMSDSGISLRSEGDRIDVAALRKERARDPLLESITVLEVMTTAFLAAILIGAGRFTAGILSLRRVVRSGFPIRAVGRVRIIAHDRVKVPFAWRSFGVVGACVPTRILADRTAVRIVLAHEFEHHRRGDTLWLWGGEILRVVFTGFPQIHFLLKWISEMQEFACDEDVLRKGRISERDYASCLLQLAESARGTPMAVLGVPMGSAGVQLKRRIHHMIGNRNVQGSQVFRARLAGVFFTGLLACATAGVATADLGERAPLTLERLKGLAKAGADVDFPVDANDRVLARLNEWLGSPGSRKHFRESLARLREHEPLLRSMIRTKAVPDELLAVALVESGFVADARSPKGQSAGMWQFITTTARNFGLNVSSAEDERLDVRKSTRAALTYLKTNYLRFGDWRLSVMAYNMGEHALMKAIRRAQTRDAWELVASGHENDSGYLEKVMAGVILLKNPSLLDS